MSRPEPRPGLPVVALVALGGALGAVARVLVGTLLPADPAGWAWATLAVNVSGCLALGVVVARTTAGTPRRAFLGTGLLGGYTTLSAVSVLLLDGAGTRHVVGTLGYAAASVVAGVLAVEAGRRAARRPGAAPAPTVPQEAA